MSAELRVGCSSWTSDAWWGKVYPEGIPDGERLRHYARKFDAVEVDSTYYRPPAPFVVRAWKAKTPDDFRFTLKLTRDYLDPKKPVDPPKLRAFTETATLLGEKLGPILLQFSPWVKPGRASAFVTELLDALDPSLRYAVELRDAGWFAPDRLEPLCAELSRRHVALAWSYLTYVDVPPALTTDFVYLRFIGDHTTVPAETHGEIRIDRSAELRLWADRLKARTSEIRSAFVFFNNHFAGFAPASVSRFREEMGLPPVDWSLGPAHERQARLP
ncbi:MAG TPA: DUF72 domain-containing protein [Thermoplasmata archaeon]|nr:DUF72 domain-containing protein [Thermoplasmata archaeon]